MQVTDLFTESSVMGSVQASQSQRPRRNASAKRPIVRDASSEDESEEAIEEYCDEDFIA